jgi:hypothetical protein
VGTGCTAPDAAQHAVGRGGRRVLPPRERVEIVLALAVADRLHAVVGVEFEEREMRWLGAGAPPLFSLSARHAAAQLTVKTRIGDMSLGRPFGRGTLMKLHLG